MNIKRTAAMAMAAIVATGCTTKTDTSVNTPNLDNTQAVIENIMTRTSIRKFEPTRLTDNQIETLLRAGMAAPSAVNKQPWEFVVVDDRALLDTIQAALPNTRISEGCQQVIVVCGNEEKALDGDSKAYWIQDCSAATENILLAAHAMGLGAVWCGVTPNKERVARLSEILGAPSYVKPFCVICVGVPAEQPQPKDKWKEENVHKNGFFPVNS